MNKPLLDNVSAVVPACPQLSPTGQERTGEERTGKEVDPSSTSPHCQSLVDVTAPVLRATPEKIRATNEYLELRDTLSWHREQLREAHAAVAHHTDEGLRVAALVDRALKRMRGAS